jgi:hypothetical protein
MSRTTSIKIRLTETELRRLRTLAGKRGISALLRRRALGVDQQEDQKEKLLVITEIACARNVLNQIARNSERQPLAAQIEIVTHLIGVERELLRLKTE